MLIPTCITTEIVPHKEIIITQAKATTARVVECKVTPHQKSGAPRLDAWGMRNLLRLPLWIVVAFFALSGHAQQTQHIQPERPPEMVYYANVYADYYHVPREIVYAVITHESGWKARTVSNMGAMGLMQLMPATAAYYSVSDPFDISQNIGAGVHYLADLIAKLSDWRLAIAGYYCGPTYPLLRGLEYANKDVVQYVNAIQRLYTRELSISPKPEVPSAAPTTEPIQQDTPEVTP
jgi:soluble lytic murein transglycosylase-like protein